MPWMTSVSTGEIIHLIDRISLDRAVKNSGVERTTLKVELSDDSAADEITALVDQPGADILKVDRSYSDLEEVFVNIVDVEI